MYMHRSVAWSVCVAMAGEHERNAGGRAVEYVRTGNRGCDERVCGSVNARVFATRCSRMAFAVGHEPARYTTSRVSGPADLSRGWAVTRAGCTVRLEPPTQTAAATNSTATLSEYRSSILRRYTYTIYYITVVATRLVMYQLSVISYHGISTIITTMSIYYNIRRIIVS